MATDSIDQQRLVVLWRWIRAQSLADHSKFITFSDLYGKHPSELPSNGNGDGSTYFLSTLEMKGKYAKRQQISNRQKGFWKAERGKTTITYDTINGDTINGEKVRLYFFLYGDQKEPRKTQWVMTEYRLVKGENQSEGVIPVLSVVTCKDNRSNTGNGSGSQGVTPHTGSKANIELYPGSNGTSYQICSVPNLSAASPFWSQDDFNHLVDFNETWAEDFQGLGGSWGFGGSPPGPQMNSANIWPNSTSMIQQVSPNIGASAATPGEDISGFKGVPPSTSNSPNIWSHTTAPFGESSMLSATPGEDSQSSGDFPDGFADNFW